MGLLSFRNIWDSCGWYFIIICSIIIMFYIRKYELEDNQINVIGSLIKKEKKIIFRKKKKKIIKGGSDNEQNTDNFVSEIESKFLDKIDDKIALENFISNIKDLSLLLVKDANYRLSDYHKYNGQLNDIEIDFKE